MDWGRIGLRCIVPLAAIGGIAVGGCAVESSGELGVAPVTQTVSALAGVVPSVGTSATLVPGPLALHSEPTIVTHSIVANVPVVSSEARSVYKVGKPYEVNGRWYHPREQPDYDAVGTASHYGRSLNGTKTANGERYDEAELTAAHTTLPLPSYIAVTNLDNNRTVLLRVNDRGPFVNGRIVDLSYRAAEVLGIAGKGLGRVRVKYVGPAPLDGDTTREQGFLTQQPWMKQAGR